MNIFPSLKASDDDKNFTFNRTNYILVAIGLFFIVLGFILLSGGATEPNVFYPDNDPTQVPEIFNFRRLTLAPITILFGFFFEIFAILWSPKSKKTEN